MISRDFAKLFAKVGLDQKKIKNILKKEDLSNKLWEIFENREINEPNPEVSELVYTLISANSAPFLQHENFLLDNIFEGKLESKTQLKLAEEYLKDKPTIDSVEEFESSCGVGIKITDEQIKDYLKTFITENKELILENEGKFTAPAVLFKCKEGMPFAEPAKIMRFHKPILKEVLGDTAAQKPKKKKPKKEKKKKEVEKFSKIDITKLVAREIEGIGNSPEHMAKHKAQFGDKVITRFPPEPNGILHIGHARAIRFNFSIAGTYGGETVLRFDDTNPEKETIEFIENIKHNVAWFGYEPAKVTHTSDYFGRIYQLTIKLIKMGYAYVCKLTQEKQKIFREKMKPSPFRNQSIEETLKEFELMKSGYYGEGEAVLRARIDHKSVDMLMRDPVLYRIMYTPHPMTGSKWAIYPMYDYSHPLVDSFEGITHSCCTLEFEIRRNLYYWPLITLDLYRPYVWEFSRLNVTYTMLSKRKILELVTRGIVDGWDDPRLFTLAGIERRGVPSEAVAEFLDHVPVTRRGNENFIQVELFDHIIGQYMDQNWSRSLAVVDPVELHITDLADDYNLPIEVCKFPNDESKGKYTINLTNKVWVDRKDVRLSEDNNFSRIFPGALIRLRYGIVIQITEVDTTGGHVVIRATSEVPEGTENNKKIGTLHWVSHKDARKVEFRSYERLFTEGVVPKDLSKLDQYIAPNTKTVTHGYVNETVFNNIKSESNFQFERNGFFAIDSDSNVADGKLVFNRVLALATKKLDKLKA